MEDARWYGVQSTFIRRHSRWRLPNFPDLQGRRRRRETTAHTDTYHGRFVEIRPNERLVEVDEFETANPQLQGEMTVTISLVDKNGGTEVIGEHEGLPPGISIADNETGWRMAPRKLALLVEGSE